MSKFIKASIWNFGANIFVRLLSIITLPFLVKYFAKSDISIFKSLQSFMVIIVIILPVGMKHLYISTPKENRINRWNLTFFLPFVAGLAVTLILIFTKDLFAYFFNETVDPFINKIIWIVPFIASLKTISIIKLSSDLNFKEISIALILKQFILYSTIIIFSYLKPVLDILIITLICTEFIETSILLLFIYKRGLRFLPIKYLKINIDKTAKKFIKYIGLEQLFNVFALQFPMIFVVFVMGKTLAPEFQLPLAAINIPASLFIGSVGKVIFPYLSNAGTNKKIRKTLFDIIYILTMILYPVLISISFFSEEIVQLLFDESWSHAVFAVRFLPLMIAFSVLNRPFTPLASIKQKPQYVLLYSLSLFLCRMLSIYIGFKYISFKGAIILFVISDAIIRILRILFDMNLIKMNYLNFIENMKGPIFGSSLLIFLLIICSKIIDCKLIVFLISFLITCAFFFFLEKRRIFSLSYKFLTNFHI